MGARGSLVASLTLALVACGSTACPDASLPDASTTEPDAALVAIALGDTGTALYGTCGTTEVSIAIDGLGTSPTGPLVPTIEGPDAAAFAIVASTCTSGVAPGEHCMVTVAHTPVATQRRYVAALHVTLADRTLSTLLVATRGDDCEAMPSVGPAHDFGAVAIGTSVTTLLSIENLGRATTGVLTVALVGTGAVAYAIVPGSDHCTGTTLAFRTQCTVEVAFSPTAPGHAGVAVRAIASGRTMPAILTGSGM